MKNRREPTPINNRIIPESSFTYLINHEKYALHANTTSTNPKSKRQSKRRLQEEEDPILVEIVEPYPKNCSDVG